jgi:hypothetical protein
MSTKEFPYPLADFITFTCYGTWLHGDKRHSVDLRHNIPLTPYLIPHEKLYQYEQKILSEPVYLLSAPQHRSIALASIQEVCQYKNWSLLAAHARSNYVHLVIHAYCKPEDILKNH